MYILYTLTCKRHHSPIFYMKNKNEYFETIKFSSEFPF